MCGYNKKGKLFLSFDTNLTEAIKVMFVHGPDLMICGNHVYNHYKDCKDVGSYLCGDLIVDMVALYPNNTNRIVTVLACSGRVLRLLEHSRVRQTIELQSVPTVLHVPKGSLGDRVICGFSDGRVIQFKIEHFSTTVEQDVLVDTSTSTNGVTCLDTFDFVGDGKPELVVGRRDGTVQVFTMKSEIDFEEIEPQQLYCQNFSESISVVQAGCFAFMAFPEVIVCTYSGKVFGLSTQSTVLKVIGVPNNESVESPTRVEMRSPDVEYSMPRSGGAQEVAPRNLTESMFEIKEMMSLSKVDGTYDLTIELGVPIEMVVFESDVAVELINVDKERYSLVFERPNYLDGQQLLATITFRQANQKRLDVKIRTIEGQHGTLEAIIRPQLMQTNTQVKRFDIKPLSLHERIHKLTPTIPLNVFTISGGFSFAEIHNWIQMSLPEIQEKLPPVDGCELFFENVLIGTVLRCEYRKGVAVFASDNVSTIAILMDVLSKEMTKKRIKLEMKRELNPNTIPHLIRMSEPKLVAHLHLMKSHDILSCLLDLDITEEEMYCLCADFRQLLIEKDRIQLQFETEKVATNRLFGVLTDVYVDWFKLKGLDVKQKIPQLMELLDKYDFRELMRLFEVEVEV